MTSLETPESNMPPKEIVLRAVNEITLTLVTEPYRMPPADILITFGYATGLILGRNMNLESHGDLMRRFSKFALDVAKGYATKGGY